MFFGLRGWHRLWGRAWGRLTRGGSFMQARDPWEKRYREHGLHLIWVGF